MSETETQPALPAADVLPVQPQATLAFRVIKAVVGPLFHLVFKFRVEGCEHVPQGGASRTAARSDASRGDVPPQKKGPYLIIANHLNWIDAWILLLVFPTEPRLHFLANPANLIQHPIHWRVVKAVGGYIPVDLAHHAGASLYQHVDRCLERGGVVAIFPEAAYGPREGELQPFKRGFAYFAIDNRVPVLPVALSGTKDLWLRKEIQVRIGQSIPAEGQTVDSLYELARRQMEELLPEYREPAGRKPLRKFLTRLLY